MNIFQRNARGMGDIKSNKISNWIFWIGGNKVDMYPFVDTRLSKQAEHFLRTMWKGEIYFDSDSSNARGTAYCVRKMLASHSVNSTLLTLAIFLLYTLIMIKESML